MNASSKQTKDFNQRQKYKKQYKAIVQDIEEKSKRQKYSPTAQHTRQKYKTMYRQPTYPPERDNRQKNISIRQKARQTKIFYKTTYCLSSKCKGQSWCHQHSYAPNVNKSPVSNACGAPKKATQMPKQVTKQLKKCKLKNLL